MPIPLLLCLKTEKVATVINQLDEYQREHHHRRFKMPMYLEDKEPPVILDCPNYQEEQEMEIDKLMRQKPESQRFAK